MAIKLIYEQGLQNQNEITSEIKTDGVKLSWEHSVQIITSRKVTKFVSFDLVLVRYSEKSLTFAKMMGNILINDKFRYLRESIQNGNRPTVTNRGFTVIFEGQITDFFHITRNVYVERLKLERNSRRKDFWGFREILYRYYSTSLEAYYYKYFSYPDHLPLFNNEVPNSYRRSVLRDRFFVCFRKISVSSVQVLLHR
jgi:hypothetical protein